LSEEEFVFTFMDGKLGIMMVTELSEELGSCFQKPKCFTTYFYYFYRIISNSVAIK